jgi:AcrR family transcriptional regulator
VTTTAPAVPLGQRERILRVALQLMAERGVKGMSMRALAGACGLNVATLYHYFPAKDVLLGEIISLQSYAEQLAEPPPVDPQRPTRERLAELVAWVWTRMGEHDDMWRLLLGESLRGGGEAIGEAAVLSATFEAALERWIVDGFPEIPGDRRIVARVLRGAVYGFFVEHLPLPVEERAGLLARRAEEIAVVLVPVEPAQDSTGGPKAASSGA